MTDNQAAKLKADRTEELQGMMHGKMFSVNRTWQLSGPTLLASLTSNTRTGRPTEITLQVSPTDLETDPATLQGIRVKLEPVGVSERMMNTHQLNDIGTQGWYADSRVTHYKIHVG